MLNARFLMNVELSIVTTKAAQFSGGQSHAARLLKRAEMGSVDRPTTKTA